MFNTLVRTALVAAVATFSTAGVVKAADISGAGSTFAYPIYAKWADAYKKQTGIGLNYQSIGSGGGIKQINANTVTFGASDMPLEPKVLAKDGLVQFPTCVGGAVPTANIPGIKPGELVLDGPTLAKIYLGEIKSWDDPAIKKLNPGVNLPSLAIASVHRSDGSGTTYIWTDYLAKVSPEWKSKVGVSTAVEWPVGIGAKGNEGVANSVIQTKGAIGYNEYAYVLQNKMTYIKLINKDGKAVEPTAASFQAAAGQADWAHAEGFNLMLTDQPGAATWPVAGATFVLVHSKPQDPAAVTSALKFFAWSFANGDKMAEDLVYVPLPGNVKDQIKKMWAEKISGIDAKSLSN
ncbi:MAG TPA: phosphate ABC transporter substrate-binding protein PstS [Methylovirgula sp.]|nr:phosphate ABC transporter substrate-binding protein PstS [Methylovirgula sp.]